jgi:predicted CXXCH cytochrome family protein
MKKTKYICLTVLISLPMVMVSQSIVNTVHNLSVSGPGTIKATSESEICIFCHTPHNSNPAGPLWNKQSQGSTYVLYSSSTTQAAIGQPDGASFLCLSCHDGTIALGNVLSRTTPITFAGGVTTMPAGTSNLTTSLSNDHPVSFIYNSALATADGELNDPATLTGPVKLENSKLQCTSCHDAHQNLFSDFLVASTQNSALCVICHNQTYWTNTTHRTSTHTWNGTAPDPWPHTTYTTVAANACENCHNPHTAGRNARLMNYPLEENNCLDCHNGNAASKNIQVQINKTYRHNVAGYLNVHDPIEATLVTTKHDECEDCHNPHASNASTAVAPFANGFTAGVRGINQSGAPVNPITNEYELCYRCHTATPGMPASPSARQIEQNNVRLEFATTSPSHHAVVGPGANSSVPSLIPPLTTSSIIYCTDCHASDGTGAPVGPHGSTFAHIEKLNYNVSDGVTESATAYALCYSCHNRTEITQENSAFPFHRKHVVEIRVSCNTCHDPHGISNTQGNSTNNTNLINFRTGTGWVTPSSSGLLKFEDQGLNRGRCYLTCHGEDHNPLSY